MPQAITIQGEKFEVPDAVLAKYDHYLTAEAPDGLRHTVRQTLCENLRNNFAKKVSDALNGAETLDPEKKGQLDTEFSAYAEKYEFGIRAAGGGTRTMDPVEREMNKLAKADLTQRYKAKYGESPAKEWLEETVPQYVERAHDDLVKRARAIIRQRSGSSAVLDEMFGQAA